MIVGAGFYVDATNPTYAKHYNMLSHVTVELPKVITEAGLPIVRLPIAISSPYTPNRTFFRLNK